MFSYTQTIQINFKWKLICGEQCAHHWDDELEWKIFQHACPEYLASLGLTLFYQLCICICKTCSHACPVFVFVFVSPWIYFFLLYGSTCISWVFGIYLRLTLLYLLCVYICICFCICICRYFHMHVVLSIWHLGSHAVVSTQSDATQMRAIPTIKLS